MKEKSLILTLYRNNSESHEGLEISLKNFADDNYELKVIYSGSTTPLLMSDGLFLSGLANICNTLSIYPTKPKADKKNGK